MSVFACAETEAVGDKPKRDFWERNCITLSITFGVRICAYIKTNRFYFAVLLSSDLIKDNVKCGKNEKVPQEAQPSA